MLAEYRFSCLSSMQLVRYSSVIACSRTLFINYQRETQYVTKEKRVFDRLTCPWECFRLSFPESSQPTEFATFAESPSTPVKKKIHVSWLLNTPLAAVLIRIRSYVYIQHSLSRPQLVLRYRRFRNDPRIVRADSLLAGSFDTGDGTSHSSQG